MIELIKIADNEMYKFKKKFFDPYWEELRKNSYDLSSAYAFFYAFWEEEDLIPYWIKEDDKNKGFMFVGFHKEKGLCIEQFYVAPKFRNNKVGEDAAREIFSKYPGKVALRIRKGNIPALGFWAKIIEKYSDSPCQDIDYFPLNFHGIKCNCEDKSYSYEFTFTTNLAKSQTDCKINDGIGK